MPAFPEKHGFSLHSTVLLIAINVSSGPTVQYNTMNDLVPSLQ